MSNLVVPGKEGRKRAQQPPVPPEISEAVELWAREWGRHARITHLMITDPPTPQIHLSPKPNDPRRKKVQEGEWAPEEAEETVHLWEYEGTAPEGSYVGIPLRSLGVRGVLRWLERGNTWSERGEVDSLQEGVDRERKRRKRAEKQVEDSDLDDVEHIAKRVKRQITDTPLIQPGID